MTKKCPICSDASASSYAPFCSKRCKLIDFGHWLKGDYKIPTEEDPASDLEVTKLEVTKTESDT